MRRGFTLLEVLVAAALLSIGLIGTLQVISQSTRTSQAVEDHARGLMVAKSKLEEILKEPVLRIGTDKGVGVDQDTDYDWAAVIEQSSTSSLVIVQVEAVHRTTKASVTLSALRRIDLSAPVDESEQ